MLALSWLQRPLGHFAKLFNFCSNSLIDSFIPDFLRCGETQFSWIKSYFQKKTNIFVFEDWIRLVSAMDPTSVDPPLAAALGNFEDYDLRTDLLDDFMNGEVIYLLKKAHRVMVSDFNRVLRTRSSFWQILPIYLTELDSNQILSNKPW